MSNVARPDLLESDDSISEISDWDSEGEAELDKATTVLDDICSQQRPTSDQQPNEHSTTTTLVTTTQIKARAKPPRVKAPSPVRISKVETRTATSSTT